MSHVHSVSKLVGAGVTRRSLVKGAAGAAALASAGAAASAAIASEAGGQAWDQEADVVVVGLGGAGAAAAVAALEAGASVVVLESEAAGGGCTAVCGGLVYLGGGTQTQIDAGVDDTLEDMRAYLAAAMGPSADAELLDVFCDKSVETYDWLVSHGVTFDGSAEIEAHVVTAPEGVVLTYSGNERAREYAAVAKPAPRGHTPNGGGAAIMSALTGIIDASDKGSILYETKGTELVKDDSGKVVGVVAADADGAEVRVKADKAVILTAGAFTYNDAMLADYAPEVASGYRARTGMPTDRGEGILMGMRAGAATRSMSRMGIWQFCYLYGDMANGVMLDYNGHRFLSEDWYGSWIGRKISQNTPDTCYMVIDAETDESALASPYGPYLAEPVAQADTVEELVAQLDVPADNALAAIERYNEECAAGEDADFGKDPVYLKPLEAGPFYALDASVSGGWGSPLTLGGLKIDARARVLDLAGEPIPGLYAAGRNSAGIYGEYPASGTSVADCLVFGRIAGEDAAAL